MDNLLIIDYDSFEFIDASCELQKLEIRKRKGILCGKSIRSCGMIIILRLRKFKFEKGLGRNSNGVKA
jgi:hypothetical protein